MAIYHCSVKIIGRSSGRSSVGSAAYRAGDKLYNEYDGLTHDYTRKSGIAHSEIMLPANAPADFADRQTLWNAVEKIEKGGKAQLAREVEVSLPVELSLDEQINLVRGYVQRAFVSRGMVADFAIHDKDTGNPHAHIMLTVRALDEQGGWLPKKTKEYILDAAGNKQYDPKTKTYKCKTITTTDWNEHSNTEVWREQWATACNQAFERKGLAERIDHRSYARQGIEQEPTVHLGYVAADMEKKGKPTRRGDINREIRASNAEYAAALQELKDELQKLEQAEPAAGQLQPAPEDVAGKINGLQAEYLRQHLALLEQKNKTEKLDNAAWNSRSRYTDAHEQFEMVLALQEQIKGMETKLGKLGMFSGAEKKKLAAQIENAKAERSQARDILQGTYGITPKNAPQKLEELKQAAEQAETERAGQPQLQTLRRQHSDTLEQYRQAVWVAMSRPDAAEIFEQVQSPKSHFQGKSINAQMQMAAAVGDLRTILQAARHHFAPEPERRHRHERGGMDGPSPFLF